MRKPANIVAIIVRTRLLDDLRGRLTILHDGGERARRGAPASVEAKIRDVQAIVPTKHHHLPLPPLVGYCDVTQKVTSG